METMAVAFRIIRVLPQQGVVFPVVVQHLLEEVWQSEERRAPDQIIEGFIRRRQFEIDGDVSAGRGSVKESPFHGLFLAK